MRVRSSRHSFAGRVDVLMLLASAVAIAQSACSRDQVARTTERAPQSARSVGAPAQGDAPGARPLPECLADAAPDGWTLTGEVEPYGSQNLYEKINGLAELFLSYDVIGLTFASFAASADADVVIDVHVYDMGTPTHAFGVFSVERSADEPPVDIGRAGYRSDANFYVWKGQYYVKVIASDATDTLARASRMLAEKLTRSLVDSGQGVWGRRVMPRANQEPRSLRYFQVDAMGLDFMRNTYTARYRKGGTVVEAFLSRRDSAETAQRVVAEYAKHAQKYGKGVERLETAGVKLLRCDMGGAFDVVFRKGRLVAGVVAVADSDAAVQAATKLWTQLGEATDPD